MKGARRIMTACACAVFTVMCAQADQRAATWTDLARHEAYSGRHAAALAATDSALAIAPDDFETRVLRARVLSWEGRFQEADALLSALGREHPDNPEVMLVTASLRYYQGRHDEAADAYRAVLRLVPDHGDAREGLFLAERARDAAAEAAPKRWRVDAGGDYSTFTHRALSDWNQQYVQVSHRLVAADDRVLLTAYAKAERHERYELVDWSFETGVYRDFSARLRTSMAGAWTPDAVFRPRWKLTAEGEWLGFSPEGASRPSLTPSLWLLAGARYEAYNDASFIGLNPGARLMWWSGWAFTGSLSRVMERGAGATTGWALRADGVTRSPRLGPVRENARFWLGVADAPETQVIAGATETVSTRTVFGGLGFDLTGAWSAMLGYARDDRENSWVRHAFNLGVAHAF